MARLFEAKFIWMDGKMLPFKKAVVPVLNHSLHYGSAAFEGERFYATKRGPALFRLRDHTRRLFRSAAALDMKIPFHQEELIGATKELIRANNFKEGYVRPIAWYGSKMGLYPGGSPVHVAIAAWPWGSYLGTQPVRVMTSTFRRLDSRAIISEAKLSGYYVNSILATNEARRNGFHEALLLDTKGYIAEGPGENFFIVKKGKLLTPSLGGILPGITRDTVIRLARDMGLEVREKRMKLDEAKRADEAFFTGTAAEITPIGKIDAKKIGKGSSGPITARMRDMYFRTVRGEETRYLSWLTFVS